MGNIRASINTPQTFEVPTPSGRVWVLTRPGRADLAGLGLLHLALGVGVDEAGRAADLVHLPAELRQQQMEAAAVGLAPAEGARRVDLVGMVQRLDETAATLVVACAPEAGKVPLPCRLVLRPEEAGEDESGERIWVGEAGLLPDLAAIGTAVELVLLEDIQAGRSFRAPRHRDAGAG